MLPESLTTPKAMLTLGDGSLLSHVLERISFIPQLETVYASFGHLHECIIPHFVNVTHELGISSHYYIDERLPGTAYWLFHDDFVNATIDEEYLWVSTVDNGMQINFEHVLDEYEELGKPAALIVPVHPSQISPEADFFMGRQHASSLLVEKMLQRHHCVTQGTLNQAFMASGLQLINPKKIRLLTAHQHFDCFRQLWEFLIQKQALYISRTTPINWCKIDSIDEWHQENIRYNDGKSAFELITPKGSS
ncbi:hypothetical protein BVX99_02080 [bacterium F16]|nr:hypothetical protein BVX99_02080 [bacterium F16]